MMAPTTEAAWTVAVAIDDRRAARPGPVAGGEGSAISWLLSPSSATKITPKLNRNACSTSDSVTARVR